MAIVIPTIESTIRALRGITEMIDLKVDLRLSLSYWLSNELLEGCSRSLLISHCHVLATVELSKPFKLVDIVELLGFGGGFRFLCQVACRLCGNRAWKQLIFTATFFSRKVTT